MHNQHSVSPDDAELPENTDLPDDAEPDRPARPARQEQTEPPTLPVISEDERADRWGDDDRTYSDEWYESQRPPHHG